MALQKGPSHGTGGPSGQVFNQRRNPGRPECEHRWGAPGWGAPGRGPQRLASEGLDSVPTGPPRFSMAPAGRARQRARTRARNWTECRREKQPTGGVKRPGGGVRGPAARAPAPEFGNGPAARAACGLVPSRGPHRQAKAEGHAHSSSSRERPHPAPGDPPGAGTQAPPGPSAESHAQGAPPPRASPCSGGNGSFPACSASSKAESSWVTKGSRFSGRDMMYCPI